MINLNLDYAREARASMDRYLEVSQQEDTLSDADSLRWQVQTIAMALVSIADSLRLIVDEPVV